MDFTLAQLEALDAIDRTGSFARAGKELHRVPSAISYAVRGLEDAIGVALFDRSGRAAILTPAGRRVLAMGREVLERGWALDRLGVELRGGWEPELHVIVDGALPMRPVTRCLRRFASGDVPTRLRVDIEYQEGVVSRFERDRADLAMVIGLAGDGDEDGLHVTPLEPLELVLVAASEHPLVGVEATPALRATHAELVVRDSSPNFSREPKRSFLGSRNVAYLSDFHSKRVALVDGAGFGWVPRHLVADDLDQQRLQLLRVEGPNTWTYHPAMVRRADYALGRGGLLFVDTLLATSRGAGRTSDCPDRSSPGGP